MTPESTQTTEDALRRVQGEFLEMPGLRLTTAQARRLWGIDVQVCESLLGALVERKFLFRTRDGAFMRVDTAAPKAAPRPPSSVAAASPRSAVLFGGTPASRFPRHHFPGGRPYGRRPRPTLPKI